MENCRQSSHYYASSSFQQLRASLASGRARAPCRHPPTSGARASRRVGFLSIVTAPLAVEWKRGQKRTRSIRQTLPQSLTRTRGFGKEKLQVARVAEKLDNLLSPLAKKDDEIDDLLTGVDRRRPGNGIIIGESRYGRDLIFSFFAFRLAAVDDARDDLVRGQAPPRESHGPKRGVSTMMPK